MVAMEQRAELQALALGLGEGVPEDAEERQGRRFQRAGPVVGWGCPPGAAICSGQRGGIRLKE
jgi:hypothetical protein